MANAIGPVQVSDRTLLIGGGVVLVLAIGGLWYVKNKVSAAAGAAADYLANDAVNVTSADNLPNTVVNKLVQATGITGTNDFTGKPNSIGGAVEEFTRPAREWFGWL